MSNPRTSRGRSAPTPSTPPEASVGLLDRPQELDESQLAMSRTGTAGTGTGTAAPAADTTQLPQLDPPGTVGAAGQQMDAGVFVAAKVLALFSTDNPDNGWAYLENVGWKRIATTNDSAHVALTLLASAARMQGNQASVRHEADNQIHEIYLW